MKFTVAAVVAGAMLAGCGGSHAIAPVSSESARGLAFTRMSASDRLVALRPASLPKGTKIYRPRIVQINTPGNVYAVDPADIETLANGDLAVRIDGHRQHFAAQSTQVTYDAQIQEVYVPPGIRTPANVGTLVDTVR